jgi:hypothetical protein
MFKLLQLGEEAIPDAGAFVLDSLSGSTQTNPPRLVAARVGGSNELVCELPTPHASSVVLRFDGVSVFPAPAGTLADAPSRAALLSVLGFPAKTPIHVNTERGPIIPACIFAAPHIHPLVLAETVAVYEDGVERAARDVFFTLDRKGTLRVWARERLPGAVWSFSCELDVLQDAELTATTRNHGDSASLLPGAFYDACAEAIVAVLRQADESAASGQASCAIVIPLVFECQPSHTSTAVATPSIQLVTDEPFLLAEGLQPLQDVSSPALAAFQSLADHGCWLVSQQGINLWHAAASDDGVDGDADGASMEYLQLGWGAAGVASESVFAWAVQPTRGELVLVKRDGSVAVAHRTPAGELRCRPLVTLQAFCTLVDGDASVACTATALVLYVLVRNAGRTTLLCVYDLATGLLMQCTDLTPLVVGTERADDATSGAPIHFAALSANCSEDGERVQPCILTGTAVLRLLEPPVDAYLAALRERLATDSGTLAGLVETDSEVSSLSKSSAHRDPAWSAAVADAMLLKVVGDLQANRALRSPPASALSCWAVRGALEWAAAQSLGAVPRSDATFATALLPPDSATLASSASAVHAAVLAAQQAAWELQHSWPIVAALLHNTEGAGSADAECLQQHAWSASELEQRCAALLRLLRSLGVSWRAIHSLVRTPARWASLHIAPAGGLTSLQLAGPPEDSDLLALLQPADAEAAYAAWLDADEGTEGDGGGDGPRGRRGRTGTGAGVAAPAPAPGRGEFKGAALGPTLRDELEAARGSFSAALLPHRERVGSDGAATAAPQPQLPATDPAAADVGPGAASDAASAARPAQDAAPAQPTGPLSLGDAIKAAAARATASKARPAAATGATGKRSTEPSAAAASSAVAAAAGPSTTATNCSRGSTVDGAAGGSPPARSGAAPRDAHATQQAHGAGGALAGAVAGAGSQLAQRLEAGKPADGRRVRSASASRAPELSAEDTALLRRVQRESPAASDLSLLNLSLLPLLLRYTGHLLHARQLLHAVRRVGTLNSSERPQLPAPLRIGAGDATPHGTGSGTLAACSAPQRPGALCDAVDEARQAAAAATALEAFCGGLLRFVGAEPAAVPESHGEAEPNHSAARADRCRAGLRAVLGHSQAVRELARLAAEHAAPTQPSRAGAASTTPAAGAVGASSAGVVGRAEPGHAYLCFVRLVSRVCPDMLPRIAAAATAATPAALRGVQPEAAKSHQRMQAQVFAEARDSAAAAAARARAAAAAEAPPPVDVALQTLLALPQAAAPAPSTHSASSTAASAATSLGPSVASGAELSLTQAALFESMGRVADAMRALLGGGQWAAGFELLARAEAEDDFVAGVTPHPMDAVAFPRPPPQAVSAPATAAAAGPGSGAAAGRDGDAAAAPLDIDGADSSTSLAGDSPVLPALSGVVDAGVIAFTLGDLAAHGILTVSGLLQQPLLTVADDAASDLASDDGQDSASLPAPSSLPSRPVSSSVSAGASIPSASHAVTFAGVRGRGAAAPGSASAVASTPHTWGGKAGMGLRSRSVRLSHSVATATATSSAVRWQERASRRVACFHVMLQFALVQGHVEALLALWRRIPPAYPLPAVVATMRQALLQPEDISPQAAAACDGEGADGADAAVAPGTAVPDRVNAATAPLPAAARVPCWAVAPALRVLVAQHRQELEALTAFWRRSAHAGGGAGDPGAVLREWKTR